MDEELSFREPEPKYIPVCKCLLSADSFLDQVVISERRQKILSTVSRTEEYIREHRIPELIQFLFTKVIVQRSNKPVIYLEKLLDDCMLFRAGYRVAPVLYEKRHLEAIIKSFDPGQRGWLSSGQVRRIYTTLGLAQEKRIEEKTSCDLILNDIIKSQESELFNLFSATTPLVEKTDGSRSNDSIF